MLNNTEPIIRKEKPEMPIKVKSDLPAQRILEDENIFVMDENRAMHQDIRPLKMLILNLMPNKEITETQILRKLSNSPLQVDIELLQTASYTPTHVDTHHLDSFYVTFDQIKNDKFDGLIITGAPLAYVMYEDVAYWDELCTIMDWAGKHVHCTYYLCWGAFAGMYHHYGIMHEYYKEKLSGIFPHTKLKPYAPLFRGFDDVFYAPHSREIYVKREDIEKIPELELMAYSDEAGVTIVKTEDSRKFFVFCHAEYDSNTLKDEYYRDLEKGLEPKIPKNYFPDDDPSKEPIVNWRATGQLLYTNWLNYYVYQSTPYDINRIDGK